MYDCGSEYSAWYPAASSLFVFRKLKQDLNTFICFMCKYKSILWPLSYCSNRPFLFSIFSENLEPAHPLGGIFKLYLGYLPCADSSDLNAQSRTNSQDTRQLVAFPIGMLCHGLVRY